MEQVNIIKEQLNNMDNQSNPMWKGVLAPGKALMGRQNMEIINQYDFSKYGLRIEIMQYNKLLGSTNTKVAQRLWYMNEANIKCRQIAIYILNSGAKVEAGAMSYFQGPLEMTTGVNDLGQAIGKAFSNKLTGERIVTPEYRGSGLLVLEPNFKHFIVVELEPGESIICDKGCYVASSLGVRVEPCFAGNVTGSLLGGEGIFQQKITGPGVVILESPVPEFELGKIELNNDTLKVDGNFVLLRSASIGMSVERSSRTLIGSAMSGEGLVNVYRGTGFIWMAPSIKIYDALNIAEMHSGELTHVDMNTSTGNAAIR